MRTLLTIALTILALLMPACSSYELYRAGTLEHVAGDPPPPLPHVEAPLRYSVGDVFCTTPSKEVVIPFKLLIAVDFSGSMDDSDPANLRTDAIEALVNSYASEPDVYFAFVGFHGATVETSLGKSFENDHDHLAAIITEIRAWATDQNTNYQATLEWAYDAIRLDINSKTHVAGTKYGIIFITDGRPNTPEGTGDAGVFANRPKIRERITGCNDYFKGDVPLGDRIEFLNTYFLNVTGPDPLASDLLRDMAEGTSKDACGDDNWGHGEFHEVADAADLNLNVNLPTMRKVFVNDHSMVFFNYHLRSFYLGGTMVMAPDTDGDGLPDEMESSDPDPTNPYDSGMYEWDTDGDGISDLVEYVLGDQSNMPTAEPPAPTPPIRAENMEKGLYMNDGQVLPSLQDTDGDGLTNAEEDRLGTDANKIDSDGDGLSDLVEIRNFMNPVNPLDAALDSDGDGYDAKTEIVQGMDPHHTESPTFRKDYAIEMTWGREYVKGEGESLRTCYDFSIENISFEPLKSRTGPPIDANAFELNFIDRTRLPLGPSDYVSRRDVTFAVSGRDRQDGFKIERPQQNPW